MTTMKDVPYFCPDCHSNRVKFSVVTTYSQRFMKDAHTGSVTEIFETSEVQEDEPVIQCMVCRFVGNEMRFIKQAEREPRTPMPTM